MARRFGPNRGCGGALGVRPFDRPGDGPVVPRASRHRRRRVSRRGGLAAATLSEEAPGSVPTRIRQIVLVVALACVLGACGGTASSSGTGAGAVTPATPSLTLTDAWLRAAPAGGVSAAYLTIANGVPTDDVLVGVSAPEFTDHASIHETTTGDDGMTGMHHAPAIAIPANGSLALQPGGVHVMLEDLKTSLVAGETVRLRLAFERAGVVEVDAQVRSE